MNELVQTKTAYALIQKAPTSAFAEVASEVLATVEISLAKVSNSWLLKNILSCNHIKEYGYFSDIEECEEHSIDGLCIKANRTVCHNLEGSYECLCDDGYSYNASEDLCEGL